MINRYYQIPNRWCTNGGARPAYNCSAAASTTGGARQRDGRHARNAARSRPTAEETPDSDPFLARLFWPACSVHPSQGHHMGGSQLPHLKGSAGLAATTRRA